MDVAQINVSQAVQARENSYLEGFRLLVKNFSEGDFKSGKAPSDLSKRQVAARAWLEAQPKKPQFIPSESEEPSLEALTSTEQAFDAFLKALTGQVVKLTGFSYEDAFEVVLKAERLWVWSQPRKEVQRPVTPQQISGVGIVQIDEPYCIPVMGESPRCPVTTEQVKEYLSIFLEAPFSPPAWFTDLSPWEQKYLRSKFQNAHKADPKDQQKLVEQAIGTIPSSLRNVPGLANFGKHTLTVTGLLGEVTCERFRFSIPPPIDILPTGMGQAERDRLTRQNLKQFLIAKDSPVQYRVQKLVEGLNLQPGNKDHPIDLPILLQTLISPFPPGGIEEKAYNDLQQALTDSKLDGRVVKFNINGKDYYVRLHIVRVNYAINSMAAPSEMMARDKENKRGELKLLQAIGLALETIKPDNGISALLTTVFEKFDLDKTDEFKKAFREIKLKDFVEQKKIFLAGPTMPAEKARFTLLLDAMQDYIELKQGKFHFKHLLIRGSHQELFLASLQQIMVDQAYGVVGGGCKSAKDRKGVVELHTDAMVIYYQKYGCFPKFKDTPENRARFVEIFKTLFNSLQAQEWAERSAPGCMGLKSIQHEVEGHSMFDTLPGDILDAIFPTPDYGRRNKFLSRMNKPRQPSPSLKKSPSRRSFKNLFSRKRRESISIPLDTVYRAPKRPKSSEEEGIPASPEGSSKSLFAAAPKPSTSVQFSSPSDVEVTDHPQIEELSLPKIDPNREPAKAIYYPVGAQVSPQSPPCVHNTLEMTGEIRSQSDSLPFCVVEFLKRNPSIDQLDLDGDSRVVNGAYYAFVALGIDPSIIRINGKKVTRSPRDEVPLSYRDTVEQSLALSKQEEQKAQEEKEEELEQEV